MIQFGLRAHDLGVLPAERLADTLASFRPASIQLALSKALSDTPTQVGALSPGYARRIRAIFESRNIGIAVLGCYINPVHPDPDARDAALAKFEEHLRFARDFGCAVVGTETGSRSPDCSFHPDTAKDETFDLLCASVECLVKTAERYGAIVGVEAVADQHTISSIERMTELLRRIDSPNLQVIYDPVNLIPAAGLSETQESFFARAVGEFGSRIVAVHLKDFRMENGKKSPPLSAGTGELDYRALFTLLQRQKPYIDAILENVTPETVRHTLAFVKRIETETSP